MVDTALVTVLMPVYNGEAFLKEAIESILCQTFTDFEFLIINDGSSDQSEEIILSYRDPRIRYVKNDSNLKLIATLNKGIELSKGKYIVRMDADDISLEHRIEAQFTFMEKHPDIGVCGSWFQSFGDKNSISKYSSEHNMIKYKMLYQCHICHPSIILRKSIFDSDKVQFDSNYQHAEDYELFTRIIGNVQFANIPEVLLRYRTHPGSVSQLNNSVQADNSLRIQKNQFKVFGYNIEDQELSDFIKLNYQEYRNVEAQANRIQEILEKLVDSNNESSYIEPSFFNIQIAQLWYHYCYTLKIKRIYFKSKLSNTGSTSFKEKIKMLLKG